jgi:hypothetical protein
MKGCFLLQHAETALHRILNHDQHFFRQIFDVNQSIAGSVIQSDEFIKFQLSLPSRELSRTDSVILK